METGKSPGIQKGKIIIFSAASGAGKTTILDHLRQIMPDLVYSISATTRPPRDHEQDGIHYFFLSEDDFKKKIDNDEFAEWEIVHDNYYGTPKSFINETINAGRHIVMDVDVYGKVKFDKVYPDAIGIFIKPPSLEELEKRVDGGKAAVAFALYPTSISQLMAVADAGKVMPPKSTWFEPKLRSGVVVYVLD